MEREPDHKWPEYITYNNSLNQWNSFFIGKPSKKIPGKIGNRTPKDENNDQNKENSLCTLEKI